MTTSIKDQIPPSVLRFLDHVPKDRPVIMLMRHSVRGPLPSGEAGNSVPITEEGWRLGRELGAMLGGRLKTLHTSPIPRCVQTAEALRAGAGTALPIISDRLLGDPGVFVLDGRRAWENWQTLGHEGVVEHLVSKDEPLPGMARPGEAARFLLHHMLAVGGEVPGIHVFVTHDSLVTATAARLARIPFSQEDWPRYLEGAFFWISGERICVGYRGAKTFRYLDRIWQQKSAVGDINSDHV